MKTRRVMVALEVETDRPLAELRDPSLWWKAGTVHQVQVNVVKTAKKRAAVRR